MGCLDSPRGQFYFEVGVSVFIVFALYSGLVAFLILENYQFSFQIGNILFMFITSSTVSLFYRSKVLGYQTIDNLIARKNQIRLFLALQIISLALFITIILYCLVELSLPISIWVDFNNIILKNNYSGSACFFILFLPLHLYYFTISSKLRKILRINTNLNSNITSHLLQQQQQQQMQEERQEIVKTTSFLSEEFPKEIKYDNICSICQDDIQNEKIISFSCQHIFHSECIRSWLKFKNNTCPNCRISITNSRHQSDKTTFIQQSQQQDNHIEIIQSLN